MAKGDSSDILMKFVLGSGPIPGESTTELQPAGSTRRPLLLEGFEKGYMFELDNFRFAVGIQDDSDEAKKAAANAATVRGQPGRAGVPLVAATGAPAGRPGVAAAPAAHASTVGQFGAWRNGNTNVKYGVQVQPITFRRALDRTSFSLLQYCIDGTTFKSAALVKRKATGSAAAGEPYLRMDFLDGVLITDVSWSNDDPVQESCTFICRSIKVQYRPQLPDGSLGVPRPGEWSMRVRPGTSS
jgi:type VI protein secretion system component Hcp